MPEQMGYSRENYDKTEKGISQASSPEEKLKLAGELKNLHDMANDEALDINQRLESRKKYIEAQEFQLSLFDENIKVIEKNLTGLRKMREKFSQQIEQAKSNTNIDNLGAPHLFSSHDKEEAMDYSTELQNASNRTTEGIGNIMYNIENVKL